MSGEPFIKGRGLSGARRERQVTSVSACALATSSGPDLWTTGPEPKFKSQVWSPLLCGLGQVTLLLWDSFSSSGANTPLIMTFEVGFPFWLVSLLMMLLILEHLCDRLSTLFWFDGLSGKVGVRLRADQCAALVKVKGDRVGDKDQWTVQHVSSNNGWYWAWDHLTCCGETRAMLRQTCALAAGRVIGGWSQGQHSSCTTLSGNPSSLVCSPWEAERFPRKGFTQAGGRPQQCADSCSFVSTASSGRLEMGRSSGLSLRSNTRNILLSVLWQQKGEGGPRCSQMIITIAVIIWCSILS